MRFAEFLVQESFNSPYPFTWDVKSDGGWTGNFNSKDGDKINVVFGRLYTAGHGPKYELIFSANGKIEPTAKQDAFRIFATVLAMTKEFIKAVNPKVIMFTAFKDEEEGRAAVSRTKLYTEFCKRFATANGYSFEKIDRSGYDDFKLTRTTD